MDSLVWMPEIRSLRARLYQDSVEIHMMSGTKSKSIQWMETKKGCPFLGKSGDCRIYSVRPIACRTYYVVSDPENCSPDRPGAEVRVVDPTHVQMPVIAAIMELSELIPTLTGSMQSMVLAGMELVSHSSAHFKKWMTGRVLADPRELMWQVPSVQMRELPKE
jgi:Fe-S-cluster containining protein